MICPVYLCYRYFRTGRTLRDGSYDDQSLEFFKDKPRTTLTINWFVWFCCVRYLSKVKKKSRIVLTYLGRVAQWIEQQPSKLWVAGPIPASINI